MMPQDTIQAIIKMRALRGYINDAKSLQRDLAARADYLEHIDEWMKAATRRSQSRAIAALITIAEDKMRELV